MNHNMYPTSLPFVSVFMPIRNETKYLQHSLNAIIYQDYPPENLELLIADGLSTDGTREIIARFQERYPHRSISLHDNPGRIVPTALNTLIPIANGDILIRVDGHCQIAPDYVRQCVDALQRTDAYIVGGKMTATGENTFGNIVALAMNSPFGTGWTRSHYSEKEEWAESVYLGAWRREIFKNIGFFDEELVRNQDDEFNYRYRANGGKILLSPKIKSIYSVRSTPIKLFKQYFQYGFWKVRVLQKHPRQLSFSKFLPPAFVGAFLFALILSFFWPLWQPILAIVLGSYLVVNLIASIWTVSTTDWKSIFLLPIVYSIIHISYGLGFLMGLIKFFNRWGDRVGKVPHWAGP